MGAQAANSATGPDAIAECAGKCAGYQCGDAGQCSNGLCSNGQGNCGGHNAVYCVGECPAPVTPTVNEYVGCFRDNNGGRDLAFAQAANTATDAGAIYECAGKCAGYSYFGLQWSNECFCDNDYGSQGNGTDCGDASTTSNGLCSNGQSNCGGHNAVYCWGSC